MVNERYEEPYDFNDVRCFGLNHIDGNGILSAAGKHSNSEKYTKPN
ncbi:MAG: hypothetical protein ICV56_05345 [Nitrososphaeraceae archaeon]|nr:hypothetical protein [Nitrososphaeraceae archaeon]